MVAVACTGALVAGCYGMVHDQVTYTIAPEYFTRLKFQQFRWADLGLPPRGFVAEIGFFAAGSVGLVAGWAQARVIAPHVSNRTMFRLAWFGFAIVLGFALLFGVAGFAHGSTQLSILQTSATAAFAETLGVNDVPAFTRVAYIHNAGYLGALAGIATATIVSWRRARAIKGRRAQSLSRADQV